MAICANGLEQWSDEELVASAVIGDLKAFDELVRRFRPAVAIVARQTLSNGDCADDVVQDAFLAAYKALPKLRDTARFGPWLCAIARNLARRAASGEAKYRTLSDLDRFIAANSHELSWNPEAERDKSEQSSRVRAAVRGISREYADVIGLHYFEGWPVARIAGFFGLPITTVKWRLHFGRKLLRRQLKEHTE